MNTLNFVFDINCSLEGYCESPDEVESGRNSEEYFYFDDAMLTLAQIEARLLQTAAIDESTLTVLPPGHRRKVAGIRS